MENLFSRWENSVWNQSMLIKLYLTSVEVSEMWQFGGNFSIFILISTWSQNTTIISTQSANQDSSAQEDWWGVPFVGGIYVLVRLSQNRNSLNVHFPEEKEWTTVSQMGPYNYMLFQVLSPTIYNLLESIRIGGNPRDNISSISITYSWIINHPQI